MQILAFVSKVHQVVLPEDAVDYEIVTLEKVYVLPTFSLSNTIRIVPTVITNLYPEFVIFQIESNIVRCPDPQYADKMIAAVDKVRVRGDSVGGVVTCIARNVPRVSIEAHQILVFVILYALSIRES